MNRSTPNLVNRDHRPRAVSVASEWARTFLTQSLIAIVLAALWVMLGLQ